MPYLFKEKLCKHLHDDQMRIALEPFFKDFIPKQGNMPFDWNQDIDVLRPENDAKFHKQLTKMLRKADVEYFKRIKEL